MTPQTKCFEQINPFIILLERLLVRDGQNWNLGLRLHPILSHFFLEIRILSFNPAQYNFIPNPSPEMELYPLIRTKIEFHPFIRKESYPPKACNSAKTASFQNRTKSLFVGFQKDCLLAECRPECRFLLFLHHT